MPALAIAGSAHAKRVDIKLRRGSLGGNKK
jgi:hypothetical protein